LLFCRGSLVPFVPKLDSRFIITVQGRSRLKQKPNLVMATHSLLHLDLNLQAVNFWFKYYNHTLTLSLQQLISNLKIFNQRKLPKAKKPQKFPRTSSTSKLPQFLRTVSFKSAASTQSSYLLFCSPCFMLRCKPARQLSMNNDTHCLTTLKKMVSVCKRLQFKKNRNNFGSRDRGKQGTGK
jgi:hypothetical protein